MNWYGKYKVATEEEPWNWGRFGRSLIGSLGFFGAVSALMLYFGMPKVDAEAAVRQQPQQVEQYLASMPQNILDQAAQQSLSLSQKPQVQEPQPQEQIDQEQPPQPQNNGLVSSENIRSQIEAHEGREPSAYLDSRGFATIGVGFNLKRPDARTLISQIGADYNSIMSGRQSLTDEQIDQLLDITLEEAIQIASQYIPDLESHPYQVQSVIIDMSFNLGPKINNFKTLQQAVLARDYQRAAERMTKTRWYNQVGDRSRNLVSQMEEASRL